MEITARDAAIYPQPGTSVPNQWRFSPDGAWLTYLDSPQLTLEQRLHAYHLSTGERRSWPSSGCTARPTPNTGAVALEPSFVARPPQPPAGQFHGTSSPDRSAQKLALILLRILARHHRMAPLRN